jgi:hypothetical protein
MKIATQKIEQRLDFNGRDARLARPRRNAPEQTTTAAHPFGCARRAGADEPAARPCLPKIERGSITIVYIALLTIMLILVTAEARALIRLRHETRFLEQQQIKRLNTAPAAEKP